MRYLALNCTKAQAKTIKKGALSFKFPTVDTHIPDPSRTPVPLHHFSTIVDTHTGIQDAWSGSRVRAEHARVLDLLFAAVAVAYARNTVADTATSITANVAIG